MTGINMVHVPFGRSSRECRLCSGGKLKVIFDPCSSRRHIRAGRCGLGGDPLRYARGPADIPTGGRLDAGYETRRGGASGAPSEHTRRDHLQAQTEINCGLADPEMKGGWPTWGHSFYGIAARLRQSIIADERRRGPGRKVLGRKADYTEVSAGHP